MLFQDICVEKYNLDNELNESVILRFAEKVHDFNSVTEIDDPLVNIQLHGFSDASLTVYGCCVCLGIERNSSIIKCDLVSAKSRVSPTKKQ